MSNITLALLRDEHRILRQLLDILEHQIAGIEQGHSPDYDIMAELLDFLVEHPDRCHHALEDRLCERLLTRRPDLRDQVERLNRDHRNLARRGRRLRRLVAEVVDGLIVPRSHLGRSGRRYLNGYREHMEGEETQVYPLLEAELRASDWVQAVTAYEWAGTPLDTALAGREYHALHARIVAGAGGTWPGGGAAGDRCPVCATD
jgi:hemerythrin-like domain-containing protein